MTGKLSKFLEAFKDMQGKYGFSTYYQWHLSHLAEDIDFNNI